MTVLSEVRRWLVLFPLVWLMGVTTIYSVFLLPTMLVVFARFRKPKWFYFFAAFGLIQVFTAILSVFGPFFDTVRLLAVLHNIFIYCILLFGVLFSYKYGVGAIFSSKWLAVAIILFFVFGVAVHQYSLNFAGGEVSYRGIFEDVMLTKVDFMFESMIPRLAMFGDYSNSAAMLSLFMFVCFLLVNPHEKRFLTILLYISSLSLALLCGSRIVVFAYVLLFPFVVFGFARKVQVGLCIFFAASLMLMQIDSVSEFVSDVQNSRQNSSDTREVIYRTSLETMMDTSPILGLGIKPRISSLDYPLGSHSTFIGYITKSGAIGLAFVSVYVVWVGCLFLASFLLGTMRGGASGGYYYVFLVMNLVICFEDIDAYGINALLFGMIMGEVLKHKVFGD